MDSVIGNCNIDNKYLLKITQKSIDKLFCTVYYCINPKIHRTEKRGKKMTKQTKINVENVAELYSISSKIAYSVLKRCYAVSFDAKIKAMQADIISGDGDGDGRALVHDAIGFLLEYAENGIIDTEKPVPVTTRHWNNQAREYEVVYMPLAQACHKYIRSRISIQGKGTPTYIAIEAITESELYRLSNYVYHGDNGDDNDDNNDFYKRFELFKAALNAIQLDVFDCIQSDMKETEISQKLDISINSVKSAKRVIREKAKKYLL